MTDKVSDQQVADLATLLSKHDASNDAKVQAVNAVKSGIKQHNVPETCAAQLFDVLRAASSSQHAAIVNAGFGSLNHLITRLSRQEPKILSKEAARTLPIVVDKLGDQKEKFRVIAAQALTTMYAVAPIDVERSVRNTAMSGKNPRAKEASMHWLVHMHLEHGLQFRGYVPLLMDLLEDADGVVRDVAKTTVIELFKDAPNAAKSDLKRQLKNFKVRPAIEQAIVKALAPTASNRSETPSEPIRPTLAASVSSVAGGERPITPAIEPKVESAEPIYVNTQRELDDIFREMGHYFEGRETEQNWLKREESVLKLRQLIAGNAVSDFHDAYLNGVRALLDGIIKAMTSLRTSLSKEGCIFVQDLANSYGPHIDPMVELLMQTLLKLSAATKKIASQLANSTVDIVLSKATYSNRLLQHIAAASQDKNVQPRLYATGWLKTILAKEEQHKAHIEHAGGVELVEKSIKRGLTDANPGVREKMRATYWSFAKMWPAKAELMMENLDATAQKLLQKDPNNPNPPKRTGGAPAVRPGLGLSKSTMGSSKPSLKEVMAQKKATLGVKNLPTRPGSAMSSFSPVRSNVNNTAAHPNTGPVQSRQRPESTIAVNTGGMSGAPMRPVRRRPERPERPELAARPATAGPYSVRTHGGPSAEATSPSDTRKTKTTTSKPPTASPRRTAQRPRPAPAPQTSEPNVSSPPSRSAVAKQSPARTTTPAKLKKTQSSPGSAGSTSRAEDLTLLVPTLSSMRSSPPRERSRSIPPLMPSPIAEMPTHAQAVEENIIPEPVKESSPEKPVLVYEDPFVDEEANPRPVFTGPVLEDKPINQDAAPVPVRALEEQPSAGTPLDPSASPDKARQNSRLLESGITRVRAKSLDVHGFRRLQSLIRDSKAVFTGDKFESLLLGLFDFLQDPLDGTAQDRAQDVKAQILATIKLLLKKEPSNFQPHVSHGMESLLAARSAYDGRAYIVSGLELLADELVMLGDASELVMTLARRLEACGDDTADGRRTLTMGLHALAMLFDKRPTYVPSETELGLLAGLERRCLESVDSGVRMDAVLLCVAMHGRLGDGKFWEILSGVGEDPKNVITYYIVKRQREQQAVAT